MLTPTYTGRHRRPAVRVDEVADNYMADVSRHLSDGRSIDEAMALGGMDADDRLLAWVETLR